MTTSVPSAAGGTGEPEQRPDKIPGQDPGKNSGQNPGKPPKTDEPVLPTTTRDDTDEGWGERRRSDNDQRLLEDRPPHWGAD